MKIIFNLTLTLLLLLPFIGFSQVVPQAPSNGIWGLIDTQYQVGTTAQGTTQAKITLQKYIFVMFTSTAKCTLKCYCKMYFTMLA